MPEKVALNNGLSRQESRNLDIEIAFLEGIVRRDPMYEDALQVLGDDYTKRGSFESGLQIDLQLADLRPKDPLVFYNLACSLCLTQNYPEAAEALEQSIDLGYSDFKWMEEDPDLADLRQRSTYRRILAKVRRLRIRVR